LGALRPLQPRFPKKPHHCRAADDSLAAEKPQASNFVRLEIMSRKGQRGGEGKGLGSHLSAADKLRRVSYIPDLGSAHPMLLLCV
jgi:hypothetical protein